MQFGNPVVGEETLIRTAIKSDNFSDSPDGVTGWRITRDGQATFYNVTIGSPEYNIDEDGNATFNSVSAETIIFGGNDLTELLAAPPRGIIVVNDSPTSSGNYSQPTQICWNRLVIPNYVIGRMYKVGSICHINCQGSAPNLIRQRVRYAWDTPTSDSSTELYTLQKSKATTALFDDTLEGDYLMRDLTVSGTDLHLGFYLDAGSVSGFRLEGKNYNRAWVEDTGSYVAAGTFNASGGGGGTPPPQQYTYTYGCADSSSFQQSGTNRGVQEMYQGYYSGTNGNQYSMVRWDTGIIGPNLAGATIDRVRILLKNTHSYLNSGMTCYVGSHNQSNLNGSHSSGQITTGLATVAFSKGQQLWFDVPVSLGEGMRDGTKKGIAIGPAPNTSQNHYGYFAGFGQSNAPQIEITFTK